MTPGIPPPPKARILGVEIEPEGPCPKLVGIAYDCGCEWREVQGVIIRRDCEAHR